MSSNARISRDIQALSPGLSSTLRVRSGPSIRHPLHSTNEAPFAPTRSKWIYFGANDGVAGFELWRIPRAKVVGQIFADGFESGDTSRWSSP